MGNNSGQQKGAEAMTVTKSLLDYLDQRYEKVSFAFYSNLYTYDCFDR